MFRVVGLNDETSLEFKSFAFKGWKNIIDFPLKFQTVDEYRYFTKI